MKKGGLIIIPLFSFIDSLILVADKSASENSGL